MSRWTCATSPSCLVAVALPHRDDTIRLATTDGLYPGEIMRLRSRWGCSRGIASHVPLLLNHGIMDSSGKA
jgi:hypothetical protein